MQLTVKGKQLDVGEALRSHVEAQISQAAEKYFNSTIEATVVFSKEASHLYKADISLHVGKGILLQTQNVAEDPYPAFDVASERMAKRLRRYKARLKDHHKRMEDAEQTEAVYYQLQAEEAESEEPEGSDEPMIIAEMATTIQSMSPSEAMMRMNLADLPALMFKNASHGGLNMVYRRGDGHVGWVDPDGNNNRQV